MISVTTALGLVAQHTHGFGSERVSLLAATNRILAIDVFADRDVPPFNRVMMDGIAIHHRSFDEGQRSFALESIQAAGQPQAALHNAAACIEVMTGAVLPLNTDAVVPYEACAIENGAATITAAYVRQYQHVHRVGSDRGKGELLIQRHTRITPATIGVLASVGMREVEVLVLPRIAICSSGDELVAVEAMPLPHQIRCSNSYMLAAALLDEGITADIFHLPDEQTSIQAELRNLLARYDVLLCSGAVSKGKYDFLPDALNASGMLTVFHSVAQRPGKPFLFGTFKDGPLVFGFPGNPASTLVSFAVYFLPWMHASLRQSVSVLYAQLATPVSFEPVLSYHLLVKLNVLDGVLYATPCQASNSGDMLGLQAADAVITLPADRSHFGAGETFPLTFLAPSFFTKA